MSSFYLARNVKINSASSIKRIIQPFRYFLQAEVCGGPLLLIATLLALALANSPWAETYTSFWENPLSIGFGKNYFTYSLKHFINDGLMTIFFFIVGLGIKHELVLGELKDRRKTILPIMAALGGMIAPAIIFILVLRGENGTGGWGIPMATDIAFAIGFLSLLGNRVSHGLKIFLLTLSIVDDLGAIIIIAIAYSSSVSIFYLCLGLAGLGVILLLNRLGVRQVPIYIFVGILIWLAFEASGIHPTVAGVMLGLLTPASARIGDKTFIEALSSLTQRWGTDNGDIKIRGNHVDQLICTARDALPPLDRLETALRPWVVYIIMPLFALANIGIPLSSEAATSSISFAVIPGLVVGKPLGILLFSWISVKFLGSKLPDNVNWKAITGTGFLAGIGFTMSIFIAGLAYEGENLLSGKMGTLIGSGISGIIGIGILFFILPNDQRN